MPCPGWWLLGPCPTILALFVVPRICSACPWKSHTVAGGAEAHVGVPLLELSKGAVSFLVNDVFVRLGSQKQEAP